MEIARSIGESALNARRTTSESGRLSTHLRVVKHPNNLSTASEAVDKLLGCLTTRRCVDSLPDSEVVRLAFKADSPIDLAISILERGLQRDLGGFFTLPCQVDEAAAGRHGTL